MSASRSRNTVLAALEAFRRYDAPRAFHAFLIFMYACENEGLTVSELGVLSGITIASAARLTKRLTGELPEFGLGPDDALLEYASCEHDRRVKYVKLSERGRLLRDQIDDLIRRGVPIKIERAA